MANLLSELGHDGFLLDEGDEVLDVIRFGAARRVGGETFSRIVRRLTPLQLADASFDRSSTVNREISQFPTLQAFGFGACRVTMDSHPVSGVEWRSRKAKEIFFFLLCNQRPLGNEELLDALWPDASFAMSDSALKTSIYRLRQALFYECISVDDAGYRINRDVPIHFDVDQFQRHLTLATRATQGSGSREDHLQKAVQLYDGQFLSGFYSEWCQDLRTDLELKYHSALMGLAEYHVVRGRFLEAADLIEKVVSADPYNEEAQYRLVDSLINANEPLIALQHLRKYTKVCREELGVQLPPRFSQHQERIFSHLPRTPATA